MAQTKLDVERWIWTDADFEKMGWHDVRVHGIARYEKVERDEEKGSEGHFSGVDLLLDIDYILKWVKPEASKRNYEFWVAPSTLVFEGILDFEMKWVGSYFDWEIYDINRQPARYPTGTAGDCWKWEIDGTGMNFLARGYKQYIRREPLLTRFQYLTWEERDGVSFSKRAWKSEA